MPVDLGAAIAFGSRHQRSCNLFFPDRFKADSNALIWRNHLWQRERRSPQSDAIMRSIADNK